MLGGIGFWVMGTPWMKSGIVKRISLVTGWIWKENGLEKAKVYKKLL